MNETNPSPAARGSALIVGAGIAGLSTAIMLSKLGFEVAVAERSETKADGAGITIQNRGIDVLHELGVLERCMEYAFVSEHGNVYDNFFDAAGNPRALPEMPRRPEDGLPAYLQIFRPRLAEILSQRAEGLGARIYRGRSVVSVSDEGDSVHVEFGDGTQGDWDILVAADGTNSRIRQQLFGDSTRPTYTGNMSIRWVKHHPPVGQRGFYVDDRSAPIVVSYPEENVIYLATGLDMEDREVSHEEAIAILRQVVGRFTAPIAGRILDLIEDEDPVIVRPYVLHNLPAPWHKGRIVVVGDAAHTVSAHLGMGGVLALEDAAVLYEELSVEDSIDAAFTRFGQRRAIRTFFAVDACRQMLELQVKYQADPKAPHRVRRRALGDLTEPY